MKNIYASIFGESPKTQQARQARDASFQSMLDSRKQAVEKQRTDDVKMARYNALGNVLTSMVQPLGWAAGGSAAGVQPYDTRQYIDAFNRAVKAGDDLRNIGTAEAEYKFNLANEDYKRMLALEDAERRRRQEREDDERKYQFQLEKQQQAFENQQKIQQQKDDARRALEEYKATHRVSRKGTGGMTVQDRILLKEMDTYREVVRLNTAKGEPYPTFEEWLDTQGYEVDAPTRSTGSRGSSGSRNSNQPAIQWATD